MNNRQPLTGEVIVAAEAAADAASRALALAKQIGYELPADSTNPDMIQRDIAANLRRSIEACLEIGRGLLVLKAACKHGEFMPRVASLGISIDLAGRFMTGARKFSNSATSRNLLPKIESQSKLLELIVLDDEQLEELAETGQTGELKLDDIACMSVSELRKKLREARQQVAVKDKVAENNQKTIQQLQERLVKQHRMKGTETALTPDAPDEPGPDDLADDALADFEATVISFREYVVDLRSAFTTLKEAIGEGPRLISRRHAALEQILGEIRQVALDFDVPLRLSDDTDMPRTDAEVGVELWDRLNAKLDAEARARGDDDGIILDAE
jgi:hypothetical protein